MRKLRKISLLWYSLVVSIFTLVAYNLPFFSFAWTHSTSTLLPRTILIVSAVIIMVLLHAMLTYLFVFLTRYVARVVIAILAIINSLATYFVYTYSVILDGSMIGNVFNTRYSEASTFFSFGMVLWVLILGVLPAVWVVWQPIKKIPKQGRRNFPFSILHFPFSTWKQLGIVCGGSLASIAVLALVNIGQVLWISSYETELGGLAMPWSYVVNTIRVKSMASAEKEKEILLPQGEITDSTKTVVVLVIGESARRANFQLYGYKRATNPLLSKQQGVTALMAQSGATYTTGGVRCMMEPVEDEGRLYEPLPNYAFRSGVDVIWRTSNWGEPPVHIKEYMDVAQLHKLYPTLSDKDDGILFAGLKQRILQSKSPKQLIILHTYTSHGPDYCKMVPKKFQVFQPVLRNVEEAEKHPKELVNSYDNSIVYTDYLLSNLIDTLKTLTKKSSSTSSSAFNCAVLFVSDHGESLGENGMFMHGMPMNMAPKEQYEIPFIVWTSEGFRKLKPVKQVDQSYVFHSVLDLLSIKSPIYNPDKDIFVTSSSRN